MFFLSYQSRIKQAFFLGSIFFGCLLKWLERQGRPRESTSTLGRGPAESYEAAGGLGGLGRPLRPLGRVVFCGIEGGLLKAPKDLKIFKSI